MFNQVSTIGRSCFLVALLPLAVAGILNAQAAPSRVVSGVVITDRNEVVPNVSVVAVYASGKKETTTDADGGFRLSVPDEPLKLAVVGKYLVSEERIIGTSEPRDGLQLRVNYTIPAVHEGLVISATALNPTIDQRNDNVYEHTVLTR
jgi:hypothetical protein